MLNEVLVIGVITTLFLIIIITNLMSVQSTRVEGYLVTAFVRTKTTGESDAWGLEWGRAGREMLIRISRVISAALN